MLNPMAPMSDEARQVVQTLVEQVHEQFIQAVAEGRENLDLELVRLLADGRIYTGQQAVDNGLVDEIGGFREALAAAGELAGIGPKPRIKEYGEPSLLRWLFSGGSMAGRRAVAQPQVGAIGGLLYDELAAQLVGQAGGSIASLGPGGVNRHGSPAGEM